jgi:membrane-bound inhibitor of C-type lysozyme
MRGGHHPGAATPRRGAPPTPWRSANRSGPKRWIAPLLALALVACAGGGSKPDEEAAKNTFACSAAGERVVLRFERGELRLLLPGSDRVTLYQVPSGSGVRYTNGSIDVFGKGLDLSMTRDGGPRVPLADCAPLVPPKT